jgi:hypothetical protein
MDVLKIGTWSARLGGGCIWPDSMASARFMDVMMGWPDGMVGARLIEVTSEPAVSVGAIEMEVTSGDPAIVVTSCATGSDMDMACGAIDDGGGGGTAIVIVMVGPWSRFYETVSA